tara:strand:- start:413 stop:673 length:261 start_codon:yes stop_codon:yes gene_type:complete
MLKINLNADQFINFNDPDSIEQYAPEDQFEFIPDELTIKDNIIYFLLDNFINPVRTFLINKFNILHFKPRGLDTLKSFEDISDFID